jgi:hypothetical protein
MEKTLPDSSIARAAHGILADLAEFLSPPERWTQKAIARNLDGVPVRFDDPSAKCWCLFGGLQKVAEPSEARTLAWRMLNTVSDKRYQQFALVGNDLHTHGEVLEMIAEAATTLAPADENIVLSAEQILAAAEELITPPECWTTHHAARDAEGKAVYASHAEAVCWCGIGAIQKVAPWSAERVKAEGLLGEVCREDHQRGPTAVNDYVGHEAILAALRKARVKAA